MLFDINNTVDVNLTGDALAQLSQAVTKLNTIVNALGLNSSRVNLGTLLGNIRSSVALCSENAVEENKKLDIISKDIQALYNYLKSGSTTEERGGGDNQIDSLRDCHTVLKDIHALLTERLERGSGGGSSPNPPGGGGRPTPDDDDDRGNISSSMQSSRDESLKRALSGITEKENSNNVLLNQLSRVGKDTFDLLKRNFTGIFDKWNTQIATLKEQGMGSSSAAQLNRMTKSTMNATEELLGFNVSIDKAIKSTNEILASGFSPTYMRENNKQLLMGLSAIGIKLEGETIREIGNQVFDATHVKELTGDLAKLVSPDSENRMDAAVLSRAFNSQEFKTIIATATMQSGASRQEVERRFAELLVQNKKNGRGDEESIERAYMDLQSTLGGGAYVHTSKNIQSMIALQQLADPNWDIRRDGLSARADIEAYNSNAEYRRKVNQVAPTLMLGGDNTAWSLQNNDGTIRRMASSQQIEEGQYEGFFPRAMKGLAGMFNAESMGGVSQSLTGDSRFITGQAFNVAGSLGELAKGALSQAPQIMYLRQIAQNTGRGGAMQSAITSGAGTVERGVGGQVKGMGTKLSGFLSSTAGKVTGAAGVLLTVADAATDIYAKVDEIKQAEVLQADQQQKIDQLDERSRSLQSQYNEALLSGSREQIEGMRDVLEKNEMQRTQHIKKQMELEAEAQNASVTAWSKGIGTGIGAAIGLAIGGPLGAALGGEVGNLVGGGAGALFGSFNTVSDMEARQEAIRRSGARYANGGIITREQEAIIGEEDKPEVILPLTRPERAEELMMEAAQLPSTSPEIASLLREGAEEKEEDKNTVADNIIAYARAQIGKPYSIYSDGFVCNTLVQSAIRSAGLDFPSGTVSTQWRNSKIHKIPLSEAKPGMIGFSNLSKVTGLPQHMGIITEDGMWINASGSAVNGNYKRGEFVASPKSKGVIEAKMNTKNDWGMVGAGYIDGMFDPAEANSFTPYVDTSNPSGMIVSNEGLSNSVDISSVPPSQQIYVQEGQYRVKPNPITQYKESIADVDIKTNKLNRDVVDLLLESKLKESTSFLEPLLYANNPFGMKDISGEVISFNSFEDGINTFISKMEKQFSMLEGLSSLSQLDMLKSGGGISLTDYTRVIASLEKLTSAIEESNRISNRNRVVPTTQMQKRTYV